MSSSCDYASILFCLFMHLSCFRRKYINSSKFCSSYSNYFFCNDIKFIKIIKINSLNVDIKMGSNKVFKQNNKVCYFINVRSHLVFFYVCRCKSKFFVQDMRLDLYNLVWIEVLRRQDVALTTMLPSSAFLPSLLHIFFSVTAMYIF